MEHRGTWIVVDGIAGSGKTTLLNRARDQLRESGTSILEQSALHDPQHHGLREWSCREEGEILFTYEPTHTWAGQAMRHELSRTDREYDLIEQAQAFALDRHVLWNRVVSPALSAGKTILQSRGISSSLVYQSDPNDPLVLEEVLRLAGNRTVLTRPPDHLILFDVDPKIAWERIHARGGESKGTFSEHIAPLEGWRNRLLDPHLLKRIEAWGTKVHRLTTNDNIDQTTTEFFALLHTLIPAPLCNAFSPSDNS